MMFKTNWIMALVGILSTIVGFMFMAFIMSKSQKYFTQQQEYLGEINGHIEEVYTGHSVVKVYNAEKRLRKDFQRINKDLYNSGWKSQFISGLMMPLMNFIGNFGYVTVSITGAVLAMNGKISFGVIVAYGIHKTIYPTSKSNGTSGYKSTIAGAASYRVFSFLGKRLEDESSKDTFLEDTEGNIEFKNVEFGYEEGKRSLRIFRHL